MVINSNSLEVHISKHILSYLLHSFELNAFKYLYTNFHFRPLHKEIKKVFLCFKRKIYIPFTEEESEQTFNEIGFKAVIEMLEDKRFSNIYSSYVLLLALNEGETVPIYLNDLKLLLEIAGIHYSEPLLKETLETLSYRQEGENDGSS